MRRPWMSLGVKRRSNALVSQLRLCTGSVPTAGSPGSGPSRVVKPDVVPQPTSRVVPPPRMNVARVLQSAAAAAAAASPSDSAAVGSSSESLRLADDFAKERSAILKRMSAGQATEQTKRAATLAGVPSSEPRATTVVADHDAAVQAVIPRAASASPVERERLREILRQHLGPEKATEVDMRFRGAVTQTSGTQLQHSRLVSSNGTEWIDVKGGATSVDEYRAGVASLLLELGVHETLIDSTMEACLLPQCTTDKDCICVVVRFAAEHTTFEMDSIQELTNRLTIFMFPQRVVTVHRIHMPAVEALKDNWDTHYGDATPTYILNKLIKDTSRTFHTNIMKSTVLFDQYEAQLFSPEKQRASIAREIYHIKRRASVYSRVLAQTATTYLAALESLNVQRYDAFSQDVEQDIAHARSIADELNDNAQSVLQLLFQLSSYQLNELMRVLTLFSAFFIPLSFIASVYGMNFEGLPGISNPNGHLYCFALMVFIAGSLGGFFRLKGFL